MRIPRTLPASLLSLALVSACKFPYPPDVGDDGGPSTDGSITDSPTGRTGPLVQNGQAADLVLGQSSFDANADRGVTARSFRPAGISCGAGRLWVAEELRHRVLGWNTPSTSDEAATYVLGQADFVSSTLRVSPTASTLSQPTGVVVAGDKVAVLDGDGRVLVWTSPPTQRGQAANLAIGANTMTELGQVTSLSAGWSDGARLVVRRTFARSRIVVWAPYPSTTSIPAGLELLTTFDTTAKDFGAGNGLDSDGQRLVVSDTVHNRVLIWNTFPTASGQPADVVLGQPTFESNASGSSASSMNGPAGVLFVDGALLVADSGNDRVLIFDPVPTTSGAAATEVLGQASTTGGLIDQAPSAVNLNEPTSLARCGNDLFVADMSNRRILRYDLALP